jgi:protein SCO1/2
MDQQNTTSSFNKKYFRLAMLGVVMGGVILAGFAYYFAHTPKTYVEAKTTTGLPKLGGPFDLLDQFGKRRTSADFSGKYMMVYFGYSFCPDICPMGLQHMSKALELLGTDIDQIAPIFITVDPERDTVDNLKTYAQNWHTSFVFLTGSEEAVKQVLQAYKVYAVKAKPDGTMADYLIDHSALIYIMGRDGKLVGFFPHTTEPEVIAKNLRTYLIQEKLPK